MAGRIALNDRCLPQRAIIALIAWLLAAVPVIAGDPAMPRGGFDDCNNNGVDDALDIDPADPDGNGEFSADCNLNLTPDECDIAACLSGDLSCADCDGNGAIDACEVGVWSPQQRIVAPDTQMLGERFGAAMAMFGARLAIGARLGGPGVSVYLYQRDNDEWVYETELPSVPFMYPQPKLDVALTADRIAFGGTTGIPGTDGVVIFRLNEIGWEWEQTITEFPNGPTGTFFGYAVAMHGDRLVIGDPNFVNGRAYVFQYRQGIWAYEALLTASDGASNDFFGQSVAISGNIIVVSAPSKFHFGNPVYGSVYVFELISGRWVETQIITQSGLPGSIHAIGDSLAMGHGWLVIGDSGQWVIPSFIPGNAFVYRRQEGSWVFDAILSGSQATSQDRFGYSVAVAEDLIVVGAPSRVDTPRNGEAYVFQRENGEWIERAIVSSPPEPEQYYLGWSVASSGNLIAAGSIGEAQGPIVGPPPPPPPDHIVGAVNTMSLANDCDADGILDECEVMAGAPDVNGNMRPDACEPDCNANALPDEFDLPTNDCNSNFTPDECDIDPADPDGDGFVSGDCDGNGAPDECQIDQFALVQTLSYPFPESADAMDSDGDWLIVADKNRLVDGIDSGGADVYRMIDRQWVFQQVLTPAVPVSNADFGGSVAIHEERAIIGAPNENKAYFFEYDGTEWVDRGLVSPPANEVWTGFGISVSIWKTSAVVGATDGAAAYEWNGSEWVALGALIPPDSINAANYGESLSIEGNWIAVGAGFFTIESVRTGAVFVFRRAGNAWEYSQRLQAADGTFSARFGQKVKLSGHRLAIGAPRASVLGNPLMHGAVYLFSDDQGQWSERLKLPEFHNGFQTEFGVQIDMIDDQLLIGAPLWRGPSSFLFGTAFLYQIESDSQANLVHFIDPPIVSGSSYGRLVALTQRGILINHPQGSSERGVWFLEALYDCNDNTIPDICETDCNANGLADECETAARDWQRFAAQLLSADSNAPNCLFDVNGDGQLDGHDIQPFVDRLLQTSP